MGRGPLSASTWQWIIREQGEEGYEGGFIVAGGDVVPSGKMISITQLGRDVGKERPDVELKWKEIELTIDLVSLWKLHTQQPYSPIWPKN